MNTATETNDLIRALGELKSLYPHWRFGQLVANVAEWADKSVWDIEDRELLAQIREHLESRKAAI